MAERRANRDGEKVLSRNKQELGRTVRVPALSVLLSHLQAGLTPADIARIYGCASVSVYKAIQRYGIDITALRTFKARRADTLAHLQMLVTSAMPGKVESTSLRDLATTFNILHNAERLEKGQSTANLSLGDVSTQISDLDATIARLEAQLGISKPPEEEAEIVPPPKPA